MFQDSLLKMSFTLFKKKKIYLCHFFNGFSQLLTGNDLDFVSPEKWEPCRVSYRRSYCNVLHIVSPSQLAQAFRNSSGQKPAKPYSGLLNPPIHQSEWPIRARSLESLLAPFKQVFRLQVCQTDRKTLIVKLSK